MSGYFPIDHGDLEHPVFGVGERRPFTRWEAYCWLLDHAAFDRFETEFQGKPVVLDRGQVATSLGEMARSWKWTRAAVQRFIKGLISANFIIYSPANVADTGPDTPTDTPSNTAVSLLTLCRYSAIPVRSRVADTSSDTPPDTSPDTRAESTLYRDTYEKKERRKRREERGTSTPSAPPTKPRQGDLLPTAEVVVMRDDVQVAFNAYQLVARDLGLAVPIGLDTKIRPGGPTRRAALRQRITETPGPESMRKPGLEGWMLALDALRNANFITSKQWRGGFSLDDMVTREKLDNLMAGRYNEVWGQGKPEHPVLREVRDYYQDHGNGAESFLHGVSKTGTVKI